MSRTVAESMIAADPADPVELAGALALAGLPADDIAEPGRVFLRFRQSGGHAVGFGGLEIYGQNALLRSVVVTPEDRGHGWGEVIVRHMLRHARNAGVAQVYLLTTTAVRFFEAQGFMPVARNLVPAEILSTRQAAGLCPASAPIMTMALTP